ncbi:DUF3040 domain-containing protein [Acaricomes phytoseiuli]|uniref:DUF3040 domain-containing protein n=1 Tax=Acaricomes phytoseiuli TaxID=291968 RepID=UPI000476CD36|nr:DUF3040 domain-containing protein [Acaricomes phytoseiuli]MCW1249541.1 DUF3040 domain-containing protein [Acaricomes phytoseiuli]
MPLSEHEQRLLDQLEQQLHASDPKFASSLGTDQARTVSARHIILGVLVAVAGIVVLLIGIGMQQIFLGVGGFLLMGAGAYIATLGRGKGGKGSAPSAGQGSRAGRSGQAKSGFMANLEQKWDERRREQ